MAEDVRVVRVSCGNCHAEVDRVEGNPVALKELAEAIAQRTVPARDEATYACPSGCKDAALEVI